MSLLKKARDLIADPTNWVQEMAYADVEGRGVAELAEACRFCAIGAVQAAGGVQDYPAVVVGECQWRVGGEVVDGIEILNEVALELFGASITDVNDDLGHAAVLKCFDKAIRDEG